MARRPIDPLRTVRTVCLALPEATERTSHGTPAFFVRDKSVIVYAWIDGHHDNQFPHLWCAAGPGVQEILVEAEPETFFRPPYVGARGWIGVRLDRAITADEIAEHCTDAYRVVAPKKLIDQLDTAAD